MNTLAEKRAAYFSSAIDRWSNSHALIMFIATVVSATVGSVIPLVLSSLFSFLIFIHTHLAFLATYKPFGGVANWLTFGRLLIVTLAVLQFNALDSWTFFFIMAIAVLMDVADGYVARTLATHSEFGRVFDMEADAFFVIAMGMYFYLTTGLGAWLLLPGLLRYIYRFALWLGPLAFFSEKKKRYAAILAGVNFICLLIAIVLPPVWQTALLVISTLLVVGSFSVSFYECFQHAKTA